MNITQWKIKKFVELKNEELYQILRLRMEIFIVEQNSIYLDLDHQDQMAYHVCGFSHEKLIAYGRVLIEKEDAYIQRVAIHEDYRRQKLGHQLMKKMLHFIEQNSDVKNIKLNAQYHLQFFYEKHGFYISGESFDDGGILHVPMLKMRN
jgi:ElaA protein